VDGLVLVNSAGPSEAELEARKNKSPPSIFSRLLTYVGFLLLRRESRVRSVLSAVYTNDKVNIDDDLVKFIVQAAFTPGAFEVYYRSTVGMNPGPGKDTLLQELPESMHIRAIWGENDPWCTKMRAIAMQQVCPRLQIDYINAGHCPHDEDPESFNAAMSNFLKESDL